MDKGHLIPNRDRNRNVKDAIETYMGTNLIAQSMDNNRLFTRQPLTASAWFNIEKWIGDGVEQGKEFYVVAGGLGNNWNSQKKTNVPEFLENPFNQGYTNPENFVDNINIPQWTWKTIVGLPKPGTDISLQTDVLTYITPNRAEPGADAWPIAHPLDNLVPLDPNDPNDKRDPITSPQQWRLPETWEVTLQELEELLNAGNPVHFDFLSHITDNNLRERLKDKGGYVPF